MERKRQAEARSRQLETEMAHAWRLNTLGEMSADLAHELNQPLTAVINYVKAAAIVLRRQGDVGHALEAIGAAEAEAQRAGMVIQGLRDFAAKREFKRSRRPLGEVVGWIMNLVANDLRHGGIAAAVDVPATLPEVYIDVVSIQQVVLNLVRNAVDALAGTHESRRRIAIAATPADEDGRFVKLSVTDLGCGMDDELLARVFCPFYTTKPDGMGIGLSLSRTIVEAHGGRITAVSAPGAGTTFSVHLPSALD
jgi:two-component system sensor kinase FixL